MAGIGRFLLLHKFGGIPAKHDILVGIKLIRCG